MSVFVDVRAKMSDFLRLRLPKQSHRARVFDLFNPVSEVMSASVSGCHIRGMTGFKKGAASAL